MVTPLNSRPARGVAQRAQRLGKKLGFRIFERSHAFGSGQPAVVGATVELAKQLTDFGGLWSPRDKAMIFPSWPALEGVLNAIVHAPPTTAARAQMPE